MAANERLDQLSTTDANNSPSGNDVIGSSLDDELRSIKANIARSAREESTATASAAATLAVTVLNKIVPVSGSAGGSTTITLPAAATAGAGFRFTAWKTDNSNNVVIDANGAETINGAANYTLSSQYEAAEFVTNGTSWIVKDSGFIKTSGGSMTGDLAFGDNDKALFGASSDLSVYHDGSNSYVSDTGTGYLLITSDGPGVRINSSTAEVMADFVPNGAVTLYYDNSAKIATTSTGIDVTGIVTSDQPAFNGQSSSNTGSDGGTTYTTVVANNFNVNRGSHYNTSTGVWTCPVAGVYKVSFYTLSIGNTVDGVFRATYSAVFKNGSAVWGTPYGYGDGYANHTGEWHVDCAANDTLEVKTINSLGGYNGINITLLG